MNDLISRQDAIDLFPNDTLEWDTFYGYIAPHFIRRMLKELQSPQTEPVRHGKWIPKMIKICGYDVASGMKCSECDQDALNAEGEEFLTDYCPYCGAKMDTEREEDGTD